MDKKRQVIAVLSTLANVNMNLATETEQELVQHAQLEISNALQNETITAFIGDWELVWGPATKNTMSKTNPDQWVTDNCMYVVKGVVPGTATPLYVVAIAGTNPISNFGWFTEDAKVDLMNKWDETDDAKGKISRGSDIGLDILLNLKDNNGHNIIVFFKGLKTPPEEIATCGHSLGGALAPLVALKLIEAQAAPKVSTYPSAGATSGNKDFAEYAGRLLSGNYFSTINEFDIVPHAWACKKILAKDNWFTLNNLEGLYNTPYFNDGDGITMPDCIKIPLATVTGLVSLKNYTRILPDKEFRFKGAAQKYDNKKDACYFKEAGWQHTKVYNASNAFNLPDNLVTQIETYLPQKKK